MGMNVTMYGSIRVVKTTINQKSRPQNCNLPNPYAQTAADATAPIVAAATMITECRSIAPNGIREYGAVMLPSWGTFGHQVNGRDTDSAGVCRAVLTIQ